MIFSGKILRALRQLKGIKQQVIATRLGISQPAYSHIENRNYIDYEKFEQILSVLGYSKKEYSDFIQNYSRQIIDN